MVALFCPPDIEKRRGKTRKFPCTKINGGGIGEEIQETLIIGTTGNNLPWIDRIGE
jgi:hypothetical protein